MPCGVDVVVTWFAGVVVVMAVEQRFPLPATTV
jgi:hypothetical protein